MDEPPENRQFSFGIAALFWLTFVVALGITFLNQVKSRYVWEGALISLLIGVGVGMLVGKLASDIRDAVFWSTLVAAFAYLSVSIDPIFAVQHRIAWSTAGALSGALAGTLFTNTLWKNLSAAALAAGLVMIAFASFFTTRAKLDATLDAVFAPLIGIMVGVLIWIIRWLESRRKMPRYVTATWLMVAVCIANILAQWSLGRLVFN